MALLFRITLFYLAAGGLIVTLFRENPAALMLGVVEELGASLSFFAMVGGWTLPMAAIAVAFVPRDQLRSRLPQALVSIFVASTFLAVFSMIKTTMPYILPFWADPFMAEADRLLHFGQDPWRIAHALSGWISPETANLIYLNGWIGPAMFLPVLLILLDPDADRVRRYTWLYAFVWIGLGNVLALAFLSAGPVYIDRLHDGAGFAGLTEALGASGIAGSPIGRVQDNLWTLYEQGRMGAGSGISAFPSVHVGMASVVALYVFERWRVLAPVSVTVVALFLFLSVYLGWHYAVDGYASIALVGLAWAAMRRRAAVRGTTAQTAANAASEGLGEAIPAE